MDFHHLRVVDYDSKSVAKKNTTNSNKYKTNDSKMRQNKRNNEMSCSPIRAQSKMQHPEAARKEHKKLAENLSKKKVNQNNDKDAAQRNIKDPLVRTVSVTDFGKRLKKCDSNCIKQRIKNRLKTHRSKKITRKKCRRSQDDIKVLYTSQRFGEQDSNHHNIPVANVPYRNSATRLTDNVCMCMHAFAGTISKKLSKTKKNRNKKVLKINRSNKELKSESVFMLSVQPKAQHVDTNKNRNNKETKTNRTNKELKSESDVLLTLQPETNHVNNSDTNKNINNKASKINRINMESKSESDVLLSMQPEAYHDNYIGEMCYSLPNYSKCKTCEARSKESNSLRSEFIKQISMGKSVSLIPHEKAYHDQKYTCKDASIKTSSINKPLSDLASSIVKQATSKHILSKVDKKCGCRPGRTMENKKRQGNAIVAIFFKMLLVLLKYFLLVLTVIAWSPCIIISLLCWYVIAPLTPDEIRADELVPACVKCGNSFFSRLVECVTRKYMQIAATFDVMKKSFGVGHVKHQVTPSPKWYGSEVKPKRPSVGVDCQPNIDKKYVLFHSPERGWLMKPMKGQHKLNWPNQVNVYPAMCGKGYQNKKSVSFWDSDAKNTSNNCQTTVKQMIGPRTCVCAHEARDSSTAQRPHIMSECSSRIPNSPLTNGKCKCPFGKVSKAVNTSPDEKSSQESHHFLEPSSSPSKRKIYGACTHHRPAPQRPKISHSDPEISESPRKPEERMRRRSSSVPHRHSSHHDKKQTSRHRVRRMEGKNVHDSRKGHKRPQTVEPKPVLAQEQLAEDTSLWSWNRFKERLTRLKTLRLTYATGVQTDKSLCDDKKALHGRVKYKKQSKSEKYFQRMKSDWDFSCKDMYLTTLNKKPCFWVYNKFPNMYPFCLTTCKMFENCCTAMLFICSACVWCPIFLCCYCCYYMICDCMCNC